jgi:hypothetical protein
MLPLFFPGWSTDCSYNFDKEEKTFSFLGAEENLFANDVTGLVSKNLSIRLNIG